MNTTNENVWLETIGDSTIKLMRKDAKRAVARIDLTTAGTWYCHVDGTSLSKDLETTKDAAVAWLSAHALQAMFS